MSVRSVNVGISTDINRITVEFKGYSCFEFSNQTVFILIESQWNLKVIGQLYAFGQKGY